MPGKELNLHQILRALRQDPARLNELVDLLNSQGELTLEDFYESADMTYLAQALAVEGSKVCKLSLVLSRLNLATLEALPQILASSKITTLVIFESTAENMMHLTTALKGNSNITTLFIHGLLISSTVEALVKYFQENKTLQSLCLTQNYLTFEDGEKLINSLKSHPTLKLLLFHGECISFPMLSELLKTNSVLTGLMLLGPKYTPDLQCLVGGLEANSTLVHLTLSDHPLCDDDIKIIASCLEKNPSLLLLELHDSKITNEGAVQLMRALEKNSLLQTLSFENSHPENKKTTNVIDKTTLETVNSFVNNRNVFILKRTEKTLLAHLIPNTLGIVIGYLGIGVAAPAGEIADSEPFPQAPFIPISIRERITHGLSSLLSTPNPLPPENRALTAPPQTVVAANNTAAPPAPSNSAPPSEMEEEAKRPAPKFGFHWKVVKKR